MHLDEEQLKYLECYEIKCPCGSDIILHSEIVHKESGKTTQYLAKCSNNKSPENIICCRAGMIWKNEFHYNWD
jgi:hypothetical protein